MKYGFLYDNLKENDIVQFDEGGNFVNFQRVSQVHCNCGSDFWTEHFHVGSYVCMYDTGDNRVDHTKRVRAIWRRKDKDTLKRVATKHPRTKIWEVEENTLENEKTDIKKVRQAANLLKLYIDEVSNG